MARLLQNNWVIFGLFLASMGIGWSFSLFTEAVGGQMLDMLMTADEAFATLADMTADQKAAHIQMTFLIDILYPLTLCSFLYGLIAKNTSGFFSVAIIAPIAAFFLDIAENTVQVLALMGNESFLAYKDFLTPTKFHAFAASAVLAVAFTLFALVRWSISKFKN